MTPPDRSARDIMEDLRKDIAETFDEPLLWGSDDDLQVRLLPLGIDAIDHMLGGGIAHGRFTLVTGAQSVGKTLLALFAAKAAAEAGLPVVWVDAEHSWEPTWAQAVGLTPDDVLVSTPRTGEAAFNVVHGTVRTPGAGLIVIDSLAALTPTAEVDENPKGMAQQFVGTQARLINRGLRTMISENRENWAVIAINQIREKIGVVYGNPETLPGGRGQSYDAWQIIRVRRAAWIEEGTGSNKRRVGYNLRMVLEKSKQTEPFRETTVPFYFTGDIDELAGELALAVDLGVIEKKPGGYYEFGELRVRGMKGLRDAVNDLPTLRAQIAAEVAAKEEAF